MLDEAVNRPRSTFAPPVAPVRYLTSVDAGWDGLLAEAFHEPPEMDGYISAARSDISLILVAGGGLYMEQRSKDSPWRSSSVADGELILRPGASITSEVRWTSLRPMPTQTLHVHLNRALLARTAESLLDRDPARLSLLGRSGLHDPLLAQIGAALWRELEKPVPAGRIYAQTAAQMLAVHLLRHYLAEPCPLPDLAGGLSQRQLSQLMEFIRAHLNHDLSLDHLADQVGFSPYHFARLFRQSTGESPHQFVLRQRLEHVQRLLRETDLPLAQVALESGFASQSHLNRLFKQRFGVTPRAYRHR